MNDRTISYDYNRDGGLALRDSASIAYERVRGAGPHAPTQMGGIQYAYDAAGRRNSSIGGPFGEWTAEYTSFNLPKRFLRGGTTLAEFDYDSLGSRVYREYQSTRVSSFENLFERVEANTSTTDVFHIYALGAEVARVALDEVTLTASALYLAHDPSGFGGALVDATGNEVDRWYSTPYGQPVTAAGVPNFALGNPPPGQGSRSYTTHPLEVLGLIDMGGRIYDPMSGAFLSADPINADESSRRSFNAYSYVDGRPTELIDPSGFTGRAVGPVGLCDCPGSDSRELESGGFGPAGDTRGPPSTWRANGGVSANGTSLGGVYFPNAGGSHAGPRRSSNVSSTSRPEVSNSRVASGRATGGAGPGRRPAATASMPGGAWEGRLLPFLESSGLGRAVMSLDGTSAAAIGAGIINGISWGSTNRGVREAVNFDPNSPAYRAGVSAGVVASLVGPSEFEAGAVVVARATRLVPGASRVIAAASGRAMSSLRSAISSAIRYSIRSAPGRWVARGVYRAGPSMFRRLLHASHYGLQPYDQLRRALWRTGIEAHHLIERRFAGVLGVQGRKMLSIAVTRSEHQVFTNAWRNAIPYGRATREATREQIMAAARQIYADYPEILRALGL